MRRFLLALTALSAIACSGAADAIKARLQDEVDKAATEAIKDSFESAAVEHAAPDGADVGTTVPADFPKNIPIYVNGKVTSAIAVDSLTERGKDFTLTLETEDSVGTVAGYYTANLKEWNKIMEANEAASFTAAFESASGRLLAINAANYGGPTTITINVSWNP